MRKIVYISGTRADFGLMQHTLAAIHAQAELDLQVLVTGMHLSDQYGMTVREIEAAGLAILDRVAVDITPATGATMARNIGTMISAFVDALQAARPDIVLLLGDRGEMLAGAIAAIHLNIPIVHIHGGERSGTVDEPVRHAISKLAHYHCVATAEAKARLAEMGEHLAHIHVTGAPGLDGLTELATLSRDALCREYGFNADEALALLVFHPVLQQAERAGAQAQVILESMVAADIQVLALMPNADAGSDAIRAVLAQYSSRVQVVSHLPRAKFVSWMKAVDFMIGNSSAGIIEAASFGTPVINLGSRQSYRQRNRNVRDVASIHAGALGTAIADTLLDDRFAPENIYGDGKTAQRITSLLLNISLAPTVLEKINAY